MSHRQILPILAIVAIGVAAFLTPFAWRVAYSAWGPTDHVVPSYLPALEPSRERAAFNATPIEELASLVPGYVIIGDSMGGRVDPDRLGALSHEPIAPVLQNATGSGYWYLVLKNYVVASGVTPKRVFVFFRDTNLTDVMFRLGGEYRSQLDTVARDSEPELNRVVSLHTPGLSAQVDVWLDRLYGLSRARAWIEPKLTAWPARVVGGSDASDVVLARVNRSFALDRLRVMTAADINTGADDDADADFPRFVNTSALPLFIALAREHRLPLCFVRVLRRPINGAAPPESARMQQYVRDLRAYLEAEGVGFIDDRDDPVLATLPYADGDHIARDARVPYTDRFWDKVQRLR